MLSFGLVVAGHFDGDRFEPIDPAKQTLYRELRPISEEWDRAALEVSGLDRDRLLSEGQPPAEAMSEAAAWVMSVAGKARPVLVAFPASFDWLFLYWYFVSFSASGSPFSFSSCLDMKTMLQRRGPRRFDQAGLDDLPPELQSARPHTHNALDDAARQAEIFQQLWLNDR